MQWLQPGLPSAPVCVYSLFISVPMIATPFASWTCARPTAAHVVFCQEVSLQNPLDAADVVVVDARLVVGGLVVVAMVVVVVVAGGLVVVVAGNLVVVAGGLVVAGSRLVVVAGVVVFTMPFFLYSWNSEAPELGIV